MTRTGLLGGSFNPAHEGHRHISLAAMAALGLDEIWWLVSPGNPLKPQRAWRRCRRGSPRPGAPPAARIRVTAIERQLGTIYTVDTLARFASPLPETPLHLADGGGQSRPVPPLARLAEDRGAGSDCGGDSAGL